MDCVKCFFCSGCDVNVINRDGWNGRKFLKKCLKVYGYWEVFIGFLVLWVYILVYEIYFEILSSNV